MTSDELLQESGCATPAAANPSSGVKFWVEKNHEGAQTARNGSLRKNDAPNPDTWSLTNPPPNSNLQECG